MSGDKPDNTNGKAGPEGQRRDGRGGRHRGFKPRREGAQGSPHETSAGSHEAQRPQSRPEDSRDGLRQDASRQDVARQDAARSMPLCPLCGKPVYDLSTALTANREAAEPAHFDCVLDRVTASETLAAGEKIVYLGSGAFGVVVFKDKSESSFTVVRRVQWEKEGEKKDWRKGLSTKITSI